MKAQLNKQTVLKSLLLGLLAVNVAANIKKVPDLKSLHLASESMVSNTPATQDDEVQPLPTKGPGAVTTNRTEAAPAPVDEAPTRHDLPKICGQRFYVLYKEVRLRNEVMTEITVRPHSGQISGFRPLTYRLSGGFDLNLDRTDVREDNDKKIAIAVKSKLGRCPEDRENLSERHAKANEKSEGKKAERHDRESDRVGRGLRECRLDKDGEPLSEHAKANCHLRQLGEIDGGDTRASRAEAIRRLEKIVKGDLRKHIKNRLMDRDESSREEGEELLSDVIDRVQDLGSDLKIEPRRLSQMVGDLEALKTGGQTYRRASELSAEVKAAKDQLREEMQAALNDARSNPNDLYLRQRVLDLQREQMQVQQMYQNQVQMDLLNGPYLQLQASQRSGHLSMGEFNDFSKPVNLLRQDLYSMVMGGQQGLLGPQSPMNPDSQRVSVPTDFMAMRTQLMNSNPRFYNSQVPTQAPAARSFVPTYSQPTFSNNFAPSHLPMSNTLSNPPAFGSVPMAPRSGSGPLQRW